MKFGFDTFQSTEVAPSQPPRRWGRFFGGLLSCLITATVCTTIALIFFENASPVDRALAIFLEALLPWMFLASLGAAIAMLIARRSWVLLGVGLVGVFCLTVVLPRLLLTCACSQASSEPPAVSNLRTINTAEVTFLSSRPADPHYGTIEDLIRAGLLDSRFATSVLQYRFLVHVSDNDYLAIATPLTKQAGRFGYQSTSDGVIRYAKENDAICDPCFPAGQAGRPVQ